ncbi:glycosyltransferase [Halosimplex sp. TS25]|uniref:glycosyltransferase n=1 Tax=Halosimplex rarum TaxID=3396619 RepID=UPI0039E9B617
MPPTVAVAHYPEGAGHATRMLAVAEAIESAGGSVRMAGGGAGREFVALNGYDEFEPTTVDYIDTYQGGSLWQAATQSLPASLGRIADYQAWLSATEPDALVTDDMFAAMAATRCDVPLYVLKHDMPGLYDDAVERAGARFHTLFQLSAAREFFYPVVWPGSAADPERATRIPPVALDGDASARDDADVVVVPSHYSSLSRIADHLRRQGYDVLDVADEDWDPVASLLPYIRGADVVVCSGYSTIMDAAVAGTPCVVHPATDEQEAVADWLERFDVTGFAVAPDQIDVLDAVASPPPEPQFDNGAEVIARRVLADLRNPDPYATPSADEPGAAAGAVPQASRLRSIATVSTLAAVCLITTTSLLSPSRWRRKLGAVASRSATAGRAAANRSRRLGHTAADAAAGAISTAADGCRRVLDRCRRVTADARVPGLSR